MDIQKLLEEAQKLNKKKTPQELLAEAQEYIDGRKYGRKGKDGNTPQKYIDYFTPNEIEVIKESIKPVKGKDYFDGKDGRSPLTVSRTEPINPQIGDLWYKI